MVLESIINFKRGQSVIYNPYNHGFTREHFYQQSKNIKGIVKSVNEIERTVGVKWEDTYSVRKYNYQRLTIL